MNVKIFQNQTPILEYFLYKNNIFIQLLEKVIQIQNLWFLFLFGKNFWIFFQLFFFLLFFIFLVEKGILNRLNKSCFFAEESSWYDGQFWKKSFFVLKNDRLLISQRFCSNNKRKFRQLLFFLYFNVIFYIIFQFL